MLAKKFRLTKKDNIPYIFKQGKKELTHLFIFKYVNNRHSPLFNIILSAKFKLSSVVRNKIRRQIYESIRVNFTLLGKKDAYSVIVLPKKEILNANFAEINREIMLFFKKLSPN